MSGPRTPLPGPGHSAHTTVGGTINVQCCMGPPMVNSDGTSYVEYEVRNIGPTGITSDALYLFQIAPDNSTTTALLSSTTQDEALFPGRIIPDGQGGVLATWTISPSNPPVPQYPYQAVDVISGVVGTPYNMPLSPNALSATQPTLVLGENGTAFATNGTDTNIGPVVASFNLTSGSLNWSYQAPAGSTLTMIAATAGNGLVAKTTDQGGADTVMRFDSTGASAASHRAGPRSMDSRSSGAPNTDTWTAAGYSLVDFLAGDAFVAKSLTSGQASLIVSGQVVDLPNSVLPSPSPAPPANAAKRKINVQVFQLDPTQAGVLPITIDMTGRVNSATAFWQKQGILLNWDKSKGTNGIQISPLCVVQPCLPSDHDYFATVGTDALFSYYQFPYFFRQFSDPKSVYYVFINSVASDEANAGTLGIPDPATPGSFTGPSNVVVAGRSAADRLPHETGHVFTLRHIFNPLNLMCGPTAGPDWAIIDFLQVFACNLGPTNALQPWQTVDAKKGAAKYEQ
jgi:hypothetical protein